MLVAESFLGSSISLVEDEGEPVEVGDSKKTINSDTWEPLEKLHKGEVRGSA